MDYAELSRAMKKKPYKNILIRSDALLTALVFLSYPLLLLYASDYADSEFPAFVLIPFCGLIAVTVMRRIINRERPFEKYGYIPVLKKRGKGRSFPSRHVFSAAVIACGWMIIYPSAGIVLMGAAVCIAAVRVLGGVHYISDVCAGFALGIGAWVFLAAV